MDLAQKTTLTAGARSDELKLRWTMTQLFFFIHSGLFSLVLIQFKEPTLFRVWACALGFGLTIVWFLATRRSQYLLAYWEERLATLESIQGDESTVFVTPDGKIPSPHGVTRDNLLKALVYVFIAAWFVLLVAAIAQLFN